MEIFIPKSSQLNLPKLITVAILQKTYQQQNISGEKCTPMIPSPLKLAYIFTAIYLLAQRPLYIEGKVWESHSVLTPVHSINVLYIAKLHRYLCYLILSGFFRNSLLSFILRFLTSKWNPSGPKWSR